MLSGNQIQKMKACVTITNDLMVVKLLISILLYCYIVSIAYCDMICPPTYVYMKALRQCQDYCSKESFLVLDGDAVVFDSPFCEDYKCRVLESCLPPSPFLQYSIKLVDTAKSSWSSGSWLTIVGEYGNLLFKNYMAELQEELYSISFYRPIAKDDNWKLTYNMITGSWTSWGYSDSAWSSVTLGSVPIVVMGTQYLRKKFVGLDRMASYELSMYYKHGVVAYVNGLEVVRDNMPAGSIQSSTYASHMYESESYHSFIRPGNEVTNYDSILAVELHFMQGVQQTSCTFNAFMALYAPSVSSSPCWVLPFDVTMDSQTNATSNTHHKAWSISTFPFVDTSPRQAFNFHKGDCYRIAPFAFTTLDFIFNSTIRAFINGLRFWPSSDVYNTPNEFSFEGVTESSEAHKPMMHATNIRFTVNQHSTFFGYMNTGVFNSYRLTIPNTNGRALYLWEVQPLVCALEEPQFIPFDSSQFSFYVNQQIDPIVPSIFGFTRCSALPALPDGLYVDEDTCTICGIPTTVQPLTEYRVISAGSQVLSGEVSIEVKPWEGNSLIVRRQYGDKAIQEAFSIFNEDDGSLLYSVPVNGGQVPFTSTEIVLHVTCTMIRVVLDCVEKSWSPSSYLFVLFRLNDKETETILKASFNEVMNLPSSYVLFAQYVIPPQSSWLYTHSILGLWYDKEVTGWKHGSMNHFSNSHSQCQFYKKVFTIDSLQNASGFVVSIRYRYGVILYVNSHEVYTNHITGPLHPTLYADSSYDSLLYRSISLPIRSIGRKDVHEYLVEGENVIAVAIITQKPQQVSSSFDCSLYLLPFEESSRVFEYSVSSSRCISGADNAFMLHHSLVMKAVDCPDGEIVLSFSQDRREWISSLLVQIAFDSLKNAPQGFLISARNRRDSNWTTLSTVKNLTFFLPGQSIRIWLENNKAYNEYRIHQFFNNGSVIILNRLDLFSDCTTMSINNLTYSDTIVYQGIRMTELYPSSPYFTQFTIHPALPSGLLMDPYTGIIQGLTHHGQTDTQYTVTARQVTGGWQSAVFNMIVERCDDLHTLVSIVVKTSRIRNNNRMMIVQGTEKTSDPLIVVDPIPCWNEYVYETICLQHDVFTLFFEERFTHIPHIDSGYSLSVSDPPFPMDSGFVQDHSSVHSISSTFSTQLPFVKKRSLWKVYGEETVPSSWTNYDFDDRTWTDMFPSQLPPMKVDTLYLRQSFIIDRLDAVPVLNVRVWYIGGILVYLNGIRVARFQLSLDTTLRSTNQEIVSSAFHILLALSGGRANRNALAVVLRFQKGTTPYFDATGAFGIETCSRILDSYTWNKSDCVENPDSLFQIGTWGVTNIPYSSPSITWRFDNEEGSFFNHYRIVSRLDYDGLSYELSALMLHSNRYETLLSSINQSLIAHSPHNHSIPYGIAGFREFQWKLHRTVWINHQFLSLSFYYCQNSASICPTNGIFPSVTEGQVSPAPCGEGFTGYRYRECVRGLFGPIRTDRCHMLPPEHVSYGTDVIEFIQGIAGISNEPSYDGIVNRFYVDETVPLPEELELDRTSGVIQGTPLEVMMRDITVYAENEGGVGSSKFLLIVRKGKCSGNDWLPEGEVGDVVTIGCRAAGIGVGRRTVQCVLSDRDGVWVIESGVCVSYIYIILVVVIIISSVVSIAVLHFSRRRKEALRKRLTVRHRLTSEGNRTIIVYL